MFTDSNIQIDRERCLACGECVERCIMDNLRLSVGPCRQACPLDISCQSYLRHLAQGRAEDAAKKLREHTPFGAILGRVCHHPCEARCEREAGCHDGAVHIRAVKRYLAENYPAIVNAPGECAPSSGLRMAVVGAGPAGLAAAYELAAAGHAVDLLEAREEAGGLLRWGIPAYRLPDAVIADTVRLLTAMGVNLRTGVRLGRDVTVEGLKKDYAAVILAVGLGKAVMPPVTLPGVVNALDLLEELRAGTTPSVSSAIVVGGGNTALDTALSLKKAHVAEVTVVCLESLDNMPVHADERREAEEEGIRFLPRWGVADITAGARLNLKLERCLSVFDGQGRFAPEMDSNSTRTLQADRVVFAIGQQSDPALAAELQAAGDTVVLAGDALGRATSVVEALASGKAAALLVHRKLTGRYPLVEDRWAAKGVVAEYESLHQQAKGGPRGPVSRLPVAARTLVDEVEQTFSEEQAVAESVRCLGCGRAFEANKTCWFCLPCEIECPAEALKVNMPYLVR